MNYKTTGVCAKEINFEIEDNKIKSVSFVNGCPGNLMGVSKLVEGMDVDEAISKLKGIDCRGKGTSCPDQLAKALEEYKENLSKKEEIQEEKEVPTPTITKEQIEKEVAKAKVEDIKVNVTKELIELGNIIKKNSLTDGVETIVAEMEKALEVLKNKIANANKKQSSK